MNIINENTTVEEVREFMRSEKPMFTKKDSKSRNTEKLAVDQMLKEIRGF